MADGKHPAPHDALFKVAFSDVENGAALLRAVVSAELRDRVDWSSLQLRPGSFRDRDLKGSENDLLFSAMAGSTEVFFYFLVEHQSSVDATMVWRLWRYVTRVWDRYATKVDGKTRLPFVLPVVVYHGERSWTAPCSIAELIDIDDLRDALGPYVPSLRYIVDDLTVLDAGGLRARGLPAFATVALWALRTASDRGFTTAVSELSDLFDAVRAAPDGRGALWTIFSYLSTISGEGEDLVGEVARRLSGPIQEDVMNLVEHFAEQKKNEGRVEGRAEGEAAGRRGLIRKLLALKFGASSSQAEDRIANATLEDVERWAERILSADSLEDVFAT